jgi:hypothetical protein
MSNLLATVNPSAVTTRTRVDGRITATRVTFTGDNTSGFGTLRAQGKALGLKGAELKEWIYSQSSGETAQAARTVARVLFNGALDKGMVPSFADFKPNGSAVFNLLPEGKAPSTKTITCQDPVALIATLTPEQKAALLAALQA